MSKHSKPVKNILISGKKICILDKTSRGILYNIQAILKVSETCIEQIFFYHKRV